jgi:hypothetical protein
LVVVRDIKERFGTNFKGKLYKNSTGSKAHTMLLNIMAKASSKDLESLEAMIESFALVADVASLAEPMLVFHVTHASWTLRKTRIFPDIPVICLHPFVLFEILLQTKSKDFNIGPISRRKRAANPAEIASSNVAA